MLTLELDFCMRGVHANPQMELYRRQLDMKLEVQERIMDANTQEGIRLGL